MKSSGFSPIAIAQLRGRASNRASSLQRMVNAIGEEIELLDRLLAKHNAGPDHDTHLELIAVGRRLSDLLDSAVPQ